jgi:hypothetical protein
MAWWGSAFVMQSYGTRRTRVFVAWRRSVIPMLWFRTVCFQRRRNCQPLSNREQSQPWQILYS